MTSPYTWSRGDEQQRVTVGDIVNGWLEGWIDGGKQWEVTGEEDRVRAGGAGGSQGWDKGYEIEIEGRQRRRWREGR